MKKKYGIKGFKVGDKVKVIDNHCFHGVEIGTTVVVKSLWEDGGVNEIKDNDDSWHVMDDELEKL